MMHYQSHRGRWWYNPMGQPKHLTVWERLCKTLREICQGYTMPEGRRRIDPVQPWGHWSAGWNPPTIPKEKAR